ncbi:VOC family protein [Desulfocurvibacter africanus]|uniref:Glyoxalase/bleomycin resistance protein/dioxygenase n=1 Tax=Desulfocurvibacter africanus subsp. africanus str. Walvis Bay TaxID=690850 RepID=F3Z1P4_DESAF|nr:VOC family protein [Desulfocurvibacter africanus]EGJ51179.1 Glyoxalase/bleomycin resistance protein/dioxygenase [Desulfocurvibacter africanus subsp. africanus str. Walvis Bay]
MAARVIHFEIPARDPERANAFYSGVFGWDVRKWEGPEDYWLLTTGPDEEPGINGAIMPQIDQSATPRVVVRVDSVDEATARVQNRGGRIAAPKMPIPGLGWFAYAEDPEGNLFGLFQPDSDAS